MFLYQLGIIIAKYVEMPAQVDTDIYYSQLPFPVVTVCNANPYKYTVIKGNPKYKDIADFYDYYLQVINNKTQGLENKYGLLDSPHEYDQAELAKDALATFSRSLGTSALSDAMYSFEELITECTYSSKPCYESDFEQFFDPLYGRCFSFNTASASQNYSAIRSGMKFGLKLLLTINQETPGGVTVLSDFLPSSEAAGARILLTERNQIVDLDNYGSYIGVGFQTSIGLLYESITRAKRPYGRCVDHHAYSEQYYKDVKHSMDTCISGCIQEKTVKACGCATPRLPKLDSQSWCTIDKLSCLASLKGSQETKTLPNMDPLKECGCDPGCEEIHYDATASLSRYPMLVYYPATPETPSKAPPTTTPATTTTKSNNGHGNGHGNGNGNGNGNQWSEWWSNLQSTTGTTDGVSSSTTRTSTTTDPVNGGNGNGGDDGIPDTTPAGFIVTTFGCDGHTDPFDANTQTNFTAIGIMQEACRLWYQENALILQIYFSDLKYNVYTEHSAYSISAAINDLGGQAGLWLGLSVISCVEVISLFVIMGMFCSYETRKKFCPKKRRDSLSDEEFDVPMDKPAPIHSSNTLKPPMELRPERL
ncbi:unnamed protein product, partial [Mesorhabditis belari]|uniref:Uncharacterized protein n=1 Tax=Mesorhabditis belari TaxID=2138241 RepID=A0AAF3EVK8_9BILA